jgi:hypothetical protein
MRNIDINKVHLKKFDTKFKYGEISNLTVIKSRGCHLNWLSADTNWIRWQVGESHKASFSEGGGTLVSEFDSPGEHGFSHTWFKLQLIVE